MADVKLSPGVHVKLSGTDRRYTVEALYCAGLHPDWGEEWARLTTVDGKPAYWKVCQIEPA